MADKNLAWWKWWTGGDKRLEELYPAPRSPSRGIRSRVKIEVLVRDGPICRHCGCRVDLSDIEFDHFPVAYCNGGPGTVENIVVSCRRCNRTRKPEPFDG